MIDLDEALRALEGDRDLLQDCLVLLSQDLPERLVALSHALQNRDLQKVATIAHTIKGSVAVVGAQELKEAALAVEMAARHDDIQRARDCSLNLSRKWKSLENFLRSKKLI